MEIKSDREALAHISKILKTQLEELEEFDGKLNEIEETMSANNVEGVNKIIENGTINILEILNQGIIENLKGLTDSFEEAANSFEELDGKLGKGVAD